MLDIKDGTLVKKIVLPPGRGWFSPMELRELCYDRTGDSMRYPMTTLLTGNHLLIFYIVTSQRNGLECDEVFLTLNLDTLEVKHTVLQRRMRDKLRLKYGKGIRYGFGLPEQEYKGDKHSILHRNAAAGLCGRKPGIDVESGGMLAPCITRDFGDELTLLDLRSGDPEEILASRKVIPAFQDSAHLLNYNVSISDYHVVKPGMVVLEVFAAHRTNFEVVSWKKEELPKAILSWQEIEERRDGYNYGDGRSFEEFCDAMGHQF